MVLSRGMLPIGYSASVGGLGMSCARPACVRRRRKDKDFNTSFDNTRLVRQTSLHLHCRDVQMCPLRTAYLWSRSVDSLLLNVGMHMSRICVTF